MKNFSQLEHLHLAATRVTTSSYYVLGSIKSLRFLNLLDNLPDVSINTIEPLKKELPTCLIIASEPVNRFGYGGFAPFFIGWPGALNFSFYIPDVKEVTPPKFNPKTVPMPMPKPTPPNPPSKVVAAPPKPPAPPPIRPVTTGGGTSGRP